MTQGHQKRIQEFMHAWQKEDYEWMGTLTTVTWRRSIARNALEEDQNVAMLGLREKGNPPDVIRQAITNEIRTKYYPMRLNAVTGYGETTEFPSTNEETPGVFHVSQAVEVEITFRDAFDKEAPTFTKRGVVEFRLICEDKEGTPGPGGQWYIHPNSYKGTFA